MADQHKKACRQYGRNDNNEESKTIMTMSTMTTLLLLPLLLLPSSYYSSNVTAFSFWTNNNNKIQRQRHVATKAYHDHHHSRQFGLLLPPPLFMMTSSSSSSGEDQASAAVTITNTSEGEDEIVGVEEVEEEKAKMMEYDYGNSKDDKVPIILLSGFLGSGKTCTLQNMLLDNNKGEDDALKLGLIVNDIASINIDAKLVTSSSPSSSSPEEEASKESKKFEGIIELQGGCACCSLLDDLLTSVNVLLDDYANENRSQNKKLDAVIIELSGLADPKAIRDNWRTNNHPVTNKASISQIITLIDVSTFTTITNTWISGVVHQQQQPDDGIIPPEELLMTSQIEVADTILINKVDLAAGQEQVQTALEVIKSMNPKANVMEVQYGRVGTPSETILKIRKRRTEEDGFDAAAAVKEEDDKDVGVNINNIDDMSLEELKYLLLDLQQHDDENENGIDDGSYNNSMITTIPENATLESARDIVWDYVLDVHFFEDEEENDYDDNATTRSTTTTSVDQLGITNFVYKAIRPFHIPLLVKLLNSYWPEIAKKKEMKAANGQREDEEEGCRLGYEEVFKGEHRHRETDDNDATTICSQQNPFHEVLRSKGFCWLAATPPPPAAAAAAAKARVTPSIENKRIHDNAVSRHHHDDITDVMYYWSHAGRHLDITAAGKWYSSSTITNNKEQQQNQGINKRRREDFVTEEFGDRRQEIVFIGSKGFDQDMITNALDRCLFTEQEMKYYREELFDVVNEDENLPTR